MVKNCPQILAHGSCSNSACKFDHNVQVCEPCGFVAPHPAMYQAHLKGKKHRIGVSGSGVVHYCPLCETAVNADVWIQHISGKRHINAAAAKGQPVDIQPEEGSPLPGYVYCDLCKTYITQQQWNTHSQGAKHQSKERYASFRTAMDEAEKDKNGVGVEGISDFDIVETSVAKQGLSALVLKVTTDTPFLKVQVLEVRLASGQGKKTRTANPGFSVKLEDTNQIVTSAHSFAFKIVFRQDHIGRYDDRVEVVMEDQQLKKRFIISRPLRAIVGSKADHKLLKPKSPYIPRKRTSRQVETKIVEGIAPPSLQAIPYVGKLPAAAIPGPLLSVLSTGSVSEIIGRVRRSFLPQSVDCDTYGRLFKHLLWIEEFRMDRDLERYDIPNATMTTHLPYYYLEIPGLAEKRPSVLVGDRILVQKHGATEGHWFEGGVHVLRKEEVGLRFHGSFKGWTSQQRYNVHFKLNRIPMRRQHQAMDTVFSQDRVLFPTSVQLPKEPYPRRGDVSIKLYNQLILTNPPQLQAVISIVKQAPGSVPFIVFGPPGTGKTITIVEAIRQVLSANPNAKVLACAPSNSAADLIASRLSALGMDTLFRFYAPSRYKNQVPPELLSYTYINADGHFSVPPMAVMKRFRVVVTTCVSASFAAGIGIPRGHYSHIFIDEAGQATEPEAVLSIKTMADNSTNIILSGDPKQLGPIIRSDVARQLGLETSYIERLMMRSVYDIQTGHGTCVIKLVKNFRSHNAILKFPNERFYNGDLEQCGDPKVINSYLQSSYLPSKKFPIVFHAVSGKDDREASSPSFFNIDEVLQVKSYVEMLRADRRFRTTDQDIGIIAPYHAQCLKLRTSLRGVADGVKVGSVEEFQGQERKVILISTVRSSREFVEYDLKHTLGFVANPRRFNVAVTRAQALLIIVGDPQVLSLDPLWRAFLNYIHLNGGWTGPPITWDPQAPVTEAGGYDRQMRDAAELDMNNFSRRMEALTLTGLDSAEDENDVDANVDRPWRDVE